jgi:uncharacterized Zn-finger protein
MVHENKRPYKCDFCEYAASKNNDLKRHIECVHEKLKQHACNICQMSFGQKGGLKTHIQSIHS